MYQPTNEYIANEEILDRRVLGYAARSGCCTALFSPLQSEQEEAPRPVLQTTPKFFPVGEIM